MEKEIKIKYKPYSSTEFMEACISEDSREGVAAYFGCSVKTITKVIKDHFPELREFPAKMTLGARVLSLRNQKRCSTCKEIKSTSEFHKDMHTTTGLVGSCKSCRKLKSRNYYENNKEKFYANKAKYRAALLHRIPAWSNQLHIEEFYAGCPKGYEVDHIIPLQGKTVSGLHVLENLQYLTVSENRSKSNKYEDE